jgi:hypothetical protein
MQKQNVSIWVICQECEKPCVKKIAFRVQDTKINLTLEAKKEYLLNDLKIIRFFDICNMTSPPHRPNWQLVSFAEVKQILMQEPDFLSDLSSLFQTKKEPNASENRFANIDLID